MMNQSNMFDQEIMEAMHSEDGWTLNHALSGMHFGKKRRKQMKDMIQHRSTT
jgi:hypothetical protein